MKFIQQSVSVFFLCCLSLYLMACQSAKQQRNSSLSSALQPYLGQSMASILKNIDLERFNVALHPQPSTNKDQLVYLFTRQATVFIPAGKSTRDHKSFIIPTQLSSTSDGYNHSLKCFIIFKFKQNLAESIEFKGRGC